MRNAILATLALALALPILAHEHERYSSKHSTTISIDFDDWDGLTTCNQVKVSIDGKPAIRAEESLPVSGLRSLRLKADHNPVYIVGGADQYAVTLCKAAALSSDLPSIRARLSGNEVSIDGDSHDEARVAFLLVRTPRGADLGVESHNGPISVQKIDGKLAATAHNGPISVKSSVGTIDVVTENGPIVYAGNRGNVKLAARNGPITVKLDGAAYEGSLDARADNGPLSLKLPSSYSSGVLVETDGHGPVSCHAEQCHGMYRSRYRSEDDDNDRPRRIELGSGRQNVHLATKNGPVSIKER